MRRNAKIVIAMALGILVTGCTSDTTKTEDKTYDKFMSYIEQGNYSMASAMETDDCEDDLGLKSMTKADSAYPKSKFGNLGDAVKKCQSYELSKYIRSRKTRKKEKNTMAKTYTFSEKCEIMNAPSFSNVFASKEYKKAVADAKKKAGNDSAKQKKEIGDAVGNIVYKMAKKQIDSATYKKGTVKVTINEKNRITDVVLSEEI